MDEMKSLKYWTIYDTTEKIRPKIEKWMQRRGISKYNRANLELLDFALKYYKEPEEDVYIRSIVRDELQKVRVSMNSVCDHKGYSHYSTQGQDFCGNCSRPLTQ